MEANHVDAPNQKYEYRSLWGEGWGEGEPQVQTGLIGNSLDRVDR